MVTLYGGTSVNIYDILWGKMFSHKNCLILAILSKEYNCRVFGFWLFERQSLEGWPFQRPSLSVLYAYSSMLINLYSLYQTLKMAFLSLKYAHSQLVVFQAGSETRWSLVSVQIVPSCYITMSASLPILSYNAYSSASLLPSASSLYAPYYLSTSTTYYTDLPSPGPRSIPYISHHCCDTRVPNRCDDARHSSSIGRIAI